MNNDPKKTAIATIALIAAAVIIVILIIIFSLSNISFGDKDSMEIYKKITAERKDQLCSSYHLNPKKVEIEYYFTKGEEISGVRFKPVVTYGTEFAPDADHVKDIFVYNALGSAKNSDIAVSNLKHITATSAGEETAFPITGIAIDNYAKSYKDYSAYVVMLEDGTYELEILTVTK